MTIKELLNNVLFEKISKEQQEIGQREMIKNNTVFTRLREYLNNKWDEKKDLTKEKTKQKNLEYKRFRKVLSLLKKEPDKELDKIKTEKLIKPNKTNEVKRIEIKNILGKEPEWYIKDGKNQIGYDKNEQLFIFQSTPANLETRAKKDGYNIKDDWLLKTYNKYLVEHEYGHLFEWLKNYIETGENERLSGTFDANKDVASREEGKADKYAFNNIYRKDRRELLKKSNLTAKNLRKDSEEFDRTEWVDIDKIYNDLLSNRTMSIKKRTDLINKVNKYSKLLYNAGKYKDADNIINILKSIEKENKAKQLKENYFNY